MCVWSHILLPIISSKKWILWKHNFLGNIKRTFQYIFHTETQSWHCLGCFYEKMGQNGPVSRDLFLWFLSYLSCEQICPDSFLWLSICPALQLRMTLELCPDTSAFCAHQCLVDPAAYCPAGPFLPEILPEPSSPCQTSRNVGDRCDQSLTGGVQSMLAVVWLLGLVKFVLDGFSSFFPLTKNGW